MRITGGELGGLTLRTPKGDRVRPTQDRVREAVFAMLGAKVPGARALDLFAGTGALGVEAGSRGAASVTWVEEDRRNVEVLKENVGLLNGRCECETVVVCDEVGRWLRRISNKEQVTSNKFSTNGERHPTSDIRQTTNDARLLTNDFRRPTLDDECRMSEVGSRMLAFDLVFADPPYEWVSRVGWGKVVEALGNGVLAEDGIFVAEQGAELPAWSGEGWEILRDKVYGGTRIFVCRKEKRNE